MRLRECRLGFRAKHLFVAARQIAHGEISLEKIGEMPTAEAREALMQIRGVGEKVANCVLLFAYGRLEAFPIDVWVERILRELYFKGSKRTKLSRCALFQKAISVPTAVMRSNFFSIGSATIRTHCPSGTRRSVQKLRHPERR